MVSWFLAQELSWQRNILRPEVLVFIVAAVSIVVFGVRGCFAQYYRHRERLAKIEAGMDPDASREGDDA